MYDLISYGASCFVIVGCAFLASRLVPASKRPEPISDLQRKADECESRVGPHW